MNASNAYSRTRELGDTRAFPQPGNAFFPFFAPIFPPTGRVQSPRTCLGRALPRRDPLLSPRRRSNRPARTRRRPNKRPAWEQAGADRKRGKRARTWGQPLAEKRAREGMGGGITQAGGFSSTPTILTHKTHAKGECFAGYPKKRIICEDYPKNREPPRPAGIPAWRSQKHQIRRGP